MVMSMNIEFYKNFIAMVEAGGMNKAAREIHVAQPALTRQLQVLEKEYGAVLVKPRKGRHTLELTEAGWILYRQARQICEADSTARSEIATLEEGLSGTLRLSLSPSLMPMVIEKGIGPFHKKYRDMTFRIRESYQVPLTEEVRRGISEIGITNAPLPDPSLFHILHEETASLVAVGKRASHFLPEKEILSAKDLENVPLAVSRSTEDTVKQFFQEADLRPPILFAVDARASALQLASEGLSAALVMWAPWERPEENMVLRPLDWPAYHHTITFFCLKGHRLSKGMERFLECLVKELG